MNLDLSKTEYLIHAVFDGLEANMLSLHHVARLVSVIHHADHITHSDQKIFIWDRMPWPRCDTLFVPYIYV